MTKASEMIDDLRARMRTWSTNEEQSSTLQASISDADTTAQLTDTRGVALGATTGILEIERELIYASLIDASGVVTIPPWGRGYLSTTAVAHPANVRVISQPLYPRQKMLDNLNDTLNRMFPSVFGVKHFNTFTTVPQLTYNLPDDAQDVLTAEWQVPDGTNRWQKVRHWVVNPGGRPTSAAGNDPDLGTTVDVGDVIMAGRPLHFIYMAKPTPLVNETDDFETATGFGASLKDVCILGAAGAMIIANETARLQVAAMEQQDRTGKIAPSAALTAGRFLEQQFQTRLAEERLSLRQLYKPRVTGPWQ